MLEHGITRDMFLVACNPNHKEKMIFNPQSNQIRHLVIASFAHLGKSNEVINDEKERDENMKKIKEKAIYGIN